MEEQNRLMLPESEEALSYRAARPSPLTLRGLLMVIFRRRNLIAGCFVAVFLGALIAVLVLPSQYQAEMKILIERERFDSVVTSGGPAPAQMQVTRLSDQEINSEVDLLQSQDLLAQVVVANSLHDNVPWWRAHLLPLPSKEERIAAAVKSLQDKMTVAPPNKSNMVTLTYLSANPQMSAKVLQSVADLYLKKHTQVHRPPGQLQFFQGEVEQNRRSLQQVETRLVDFSRKEGVIAADVEKANTLQRLAEFEASLQATRGSISATEERIRELQAQLEKTPERRITQVKTASALLEQLKATLFNLELKRTDLLSRYEPSHRNVQDIDRQIVEAKAAIAKVEAQPTNEQTTDPDPTHDWVMAELTKARAEQAALKAQAMATERSIAEYKEKAQVLTAKGVEQQALIRSAKATEENYLNSVRKQEEARLSEALDQQRIVNVAIAEAPIVPALPKYSIPLQLFVGLVLACLVSLGVGFATDYWDPSFRTPEELAGFLGLPVLAAVPRRSLLKTAGTETQDTEALSEIR